MLRRLKNWLFSSQRPMEDFFICDECMEPFTGTALRVKDRFGISEVCSWCSDVLVRNTGAVVIERNQK